MDAKPLVRSIVCPWHERVRADIAGRSRCPLVDVVVVVVVVVLILVFLLLLLDTVIDIFLLVVLQ